MLEDMHHLALDYLSEELEGGSPPECPEEWFRRLRQEQGEVLFPYLVEASEKIERVYIIRPSPDDPGLALLSPKENTKENQRRYPFNQPTGSQSAALGPVFKRTYTKKKGPGPSAKIRKTTLDQFEKYSKEDSPWSSYFAEIVDILHRPRLLSDGSAIEEVCSPSQSLLDLAVESIDETKTVFLTVADHKGRLPGERQEYKDYLAETLAETKYTTGKVRRQSGQSCPLCGRKGDLYPNALKGAGLNIAHVDRWGAFAGLLQEAAWKSYALCLDCADLLYIYKNYVSKLFFTFVAGEKALLIPHVSLQGEKRHEFMEEMQLYARRTYALRTQSGGTPSGVMRQEEELLDFLSEEEAVASLTILWAKFGQLIEDVRGVITDVLPSRLGELSQVNSKTRRWEHPLFPRHPLPKADFDLSLRCLGSLLRRPGGRKVQNLNASRRLFELRRGLAAAIYHRDPFPPARFWQEVFLTARCYLSHLQDNKAWFQLREEGLSKKGEVYLTLAGWVRHLVRLLHYLRLTEVFPMCDKPYEPQLELLHPFFGEESGIDSPQKAFAFLLGMLYGKVMEVQGARGVNVGANALTWLKRLNLRGGDLPELYVKIREKLLAYETEKSSTVREVLREVGRLGVQLGDHIPLDNTQTCYFLLLGQSLSSTVLSKPKEPGADPEGSSPDGANEPDPQERPKESGAAQEDSSPQQYDLLESQRAR